MKHFLLSIAALLLSAAGFAAENSGISAQEQTEIQIATTPAPRPKWQKRYDAKRQEAKELGTKAKIDLVCRHPALREEIREVITCSLWSRRGRSRSTRSPAA